MNSASAEPRIRFQPLRRFTTEVAIELGRRLKLDLAPVLNGARNHLPPGNTRESYRMILIGYSWSVRRMPGAPQYGFYITMRSKGPF